MNRKSILIIHLVLFIFFALVAVFTPGTGGGGDSLAHYFISEYSWTNPRFFFKHWGKPFFIFFSSGFAQFGFVGIKVFNVLCATLASYITCLVANKLNKKPVWLIPFIAFSAPGLYVYVMSGLTEPFSALVCILSVHLLLQNKISLGFILASFLPFCRSEAQLFLILFAAYGILNGKWKHLPFLLSGYIVYAIIGKLSYFDSFFWIFDIPYKAGPSPYGSGPWFHYGARLYAMLAWPSFILLCLGFIKAGIRIYTQKLFWRTEALLIQAMALSLIIAHSYVWAKGIYASAGLERVLVVVFPFIWIIILDGFILLNDLISRFSKKWIPSLVYLFIVGQILVNYKSPVSGYYRSLVTKIGIEDILLRDEVAPFIEANYPNVECFIVEKPYLALMLGINPMDARVRGDWNVINADTIKLPQNEALFIWDNHYPLPQYGASLEIAQKHPQLKQVKEFRTATDWHFVIFEYTPR